MYTVKRTFELTADVIQIKAAQAGLFSSFFLGKTGSTFFRASSLMRFIFSGVIGTPLFLFSLCYHIPPRRATAAAAPKEQKKEPPEHPAAHKEKRGKGEKLLSLATTILYQNGYKKLLRNC